VRHEPNSAGVVESRLFSRAAITIVALLLTFAAFDDITTDNATTFRVEYTLLVACAGWLLFVAWSLLRDGHRALGIASLASLAGALWAQHAIGPRSSMAREVRPEYVVITAAYLWFWVLAATMLWFAWREWKGRERQAA
jgi:hypothetical protein